MFTKCARPNQTKRSGVFLKRFTESYRVLSNLTESDLTESYFTESYRVSPRQHCLRLGKSEVKVNCNNTGHKCRKYHERIFLKFKDAMQPDNVFNLQSYGSVQAP
jgi:hypothetical protein